MTPANNKQTGALTASTPGRHRETSPAFRTAVIGGLILQVPLVVLCALMLDGGRMRRLAAIAMAAYWVIALVIGWRRAAAPTRWDQLFIKWGFVVILVAAFVGAMFIAPQ